MAELLGGQQFLSFLKSLPVADLYKLYESAATCVAVLRYLSPMEQLFVSRMLFIDEAVPSIIVESWLKEKSKHSLPNIMDTLSTLHLINDSAKRISLASTFRNGLQSAIISSKLSDVVEVEVDAKHSKTARDLEIYGLERWECILKYMALPSPEAEKAVSHECRQILQAAGFVKGCHNGSVPEITSMGFKFLLTDRTAQLWIYLLNYLKYLQSKSLNVVEPLTFLLHLSFCSVGKAYSSKDLSEHMEDFLQQLREAGIVYQRKRKSGWFYPTSLALSLSQSCNDSKAPGCDRSDLSGFIVVETNFRLYAYTNSILQLAIISTFADLSARFENMCVALLTRESVRRALQVGITSKQIIDYLTCNAHEIMLNNTPIVPTVIRDQLKLWELERDRFQFDQGSLYTNFTSDDEFISFRDLALKQKYLLWENPNSRMIVIKREGVEPMKQWRK